MRGSSKHLDSVKEATEGGEGCGWHSLHLGKGWAAGRPREGRAAKHRVESSRTAAPITHSLPCPSLAPDLIQDLVREGPFGGNSCGRKESRITVSATTGVRCLGYTSSLEKHACPLLLSSQFGDKTQMRSKAGWS